MLYFEDNVNFKLKGSVTILKKKQGEDWKPIFEDHNIVVNHSAWIVCHLLRGSTGSTEDSSVSASNFNIRKIWLGNHTNEDGFSFPAEYVYHGAHNTTLSWSRTLPLSSISKSDLGYEGVAVCDVVRDENNEISLDTTAMNTLDETSRELALRFTTIIDYSENDGFNNGETEYNVIALSTNESISLASKTPHVFAIRNLGNRVISKTYDEAVKIVWAIIFSEAVEEESQPS